MKDAPGEERRFCFPRNVWPKLMMVVLLLVSHQDEIAGCNFADLFTEGQKAANCDSADQN
jgi:hypothetical protein